MRCAALPILAVLVAAVAGCGDDSDGSSRVRGDTLTIYASLPAHGETAAAGAAAEAGMRRALEDADGQAAGRDVRLTVLPSTRPEDAFWDPGTVEANAERATDDPTAIAYLGELDQGGSAVSLPVTNGAGLLQVSPADGLTSLTRTPPGRPRAGPERYYPEGRRTFARVIPPDIESARGIVRALREQGARRLAVLHGDRIADRELEGMVFALIDPGPPQTVVRVGVRDGMDPEEITDLVDEVVAARPDAVVYMGAAGPEAAAALSGLAQQLPAVPLQGGPPLATALAELTPDRSCAWTAVPRRAELTPRARRLLASIAREEGSPVGTEALLGYASMQLALQSIADGGPDRWRVAKAARAPRERQSPLGGYVVERRGDPIGFRPTCVTL